MAKSAQAFRTIREVADWLGVAAHVLRFWESKFSQIKPVKRAGGRRYYRPSDMQLVGGIKVLLHDRGMTIRGVKKMISDEGLEAITALSPPIDSLLEDPDVIDITPDKEWEADAVAETQGSDDGDIDQDDLAEAPVEEMPEAEVDTTAVEDDAAETSDTAATAEEEQVELSTPPDEPDAVEEPDPAPSDLAETPIPPQPTAPAGAQMAQLAQLARSVDTLAPHLPALKALRDRMGQTLHSG